MLRTLVPTADGLLWVGTDDGVYRYDGTRLVSINALRRGGPALPAVPCSFLLPLPTGSSGWAPTPGFTALGRPGYCSPAAAFSWQQQQYHRVADAGGQRRVMVSQSHGGLQVYTFAGHKVGALFPGDKLTESWTAPDGSLWLVSDSSTCQLSATGRLLGKWHLATSAGLRPVYDPLGRPWLLSARAAYRPLPGGQLVKQWVWDNQQAEEFPQLLRSAAGPTVLCAGKCYSWNGPLDQTHACACGLACRCRPGPLPYGGASCGPMP